LLGSFVIRSMLRAIVESGDYREPRFAVRNAVT
jgi:hypothetical protein